MLIRQIALFSKTPKVAPQELALVSAALQKQVTRDFSPIWEIKATVDAFASEQDIPQGYWKVAVMDNIPAPPAAGGFHLDEQGQPFADIRWSPAWSRTASHEVLEMLVDPFGHLTIPGPSPKKDQGQVRFLVEVCDPCESEDCAYMINTGSAHEILVSDFYTPDYFAPVAAPGVRYSFQGHIHAPRQVLNGGYLSWWNPADGHVWQLFGPAELGGFKDGGENTLNRETTDQLAAVGRTDIRRIALTAAQAGGPPAGNCNLTLDLSTGNLLGIKDAQTTVNIEDPSGSALFLSISYNGAQIGANTNTASFTIAEGRTPLTFVFAAPVPGDTIRIVDPCGALLDAFPNNLGDPTHRETVVA